MCMDGSAVPLVATSLLQMPQIGPSTLREKHCGLEDGLRYVAMGACVIGGIWSFVNNWMVPASMCVIAGVAISAQHIVDKNCGELAKAIKVAQQRFGKYTEALTEADRTAKNLGDANKAWTSLHAQTKEQLEILRKQYADIESGGHKIGEDVEALKAENQKMRVASEEFTKTVAEKTALIETLQVETGKLSQYNQKIEEELQKITQLIPEFTQKEKQLREATGELKEQLDEFATTLRKLETLRTIIEQMRAENDRLQKLVEAANQAVDRLEGNTSKLEELRRTDSAQGHELEKIAEEIEKDTQAWQETQKQLAEALKDKDP